MLRLADSWVWDNWYAIDDDGVHHAFYLRASRGLRDPERRHRNPSVGHAVSTDLLHWTVLADALAISEPGAFDDYTTWTGSVVRDDASRWRMFYTGTTRRDGGEIQRIGMASSADMVTWDKHGPEAVIEADGRWYEKRAPDWYDEAWRDPFVFRGEDGHWHMLVTARAGDGPAAGRGVVGHCTSPDLEHWSVQPPLTSPQSGFGQLEVTQVEVVDGTPTLVFCCMAAQLDDAGRARHGTGGVFSVTGASLLGPFDITAAQRFPDDGLYAGRLVCDRGSWWLIGFVNVVDGEFVGELADPIPVTSTAGVGLRRLEPTAGVA